MKLHKQKKKLRIIRSFIKHGDKNDTIKDNTINEVTIIEEKAANIISSLSTGVKNFINEKN